MKVINNLNNLKDPLHMAEFLAEQMRSIARRLEQIEKPLAEDATMADHEHHRLVGTINPKKLAELLDGQEMPGVEDVGTFTRALNIVRSGKIENLNRLQLRELALAFIALLQADRKVTNQIMMALRQVSAAPGKKHHDSIMEAAGDDEQLVKNQISKAEALVKSLNGTMDQQGSKYIITVPGLRDDNKVFKFQFTLHSHPDLRETAVAFKGPFTKDIHNEGMCDISLLSPVIKHFIQGFKSGSLKGAAPITLADARKMGLLKGYIER